MDNLLYLEIEVGEAKGKKTPFAGKPIIVGRQENCDIILANDSLVSRQHARFFLEGQQIFVENLGSLNGVFVNRAPIQGKQILKPGDQVIIGNHLLVLKTEGDPKPAAAQPPPDPLNDLQSQVSSAAAVSFAKPSAQDAIRRLQLFFQLTRASTSNNSTENFVRMILNFIFQDVRVARACFFLLHPQTQQMHPVCYKIRGQDENKSQFQIPVEPLNAALAETKTLVFTQVANQAETIPHVLVIPLLANGRMLGLIYLDSPQADFSAKQSDLEFLEALAQQGAACIAKSRMEEDLRHQEEVLKRLEKHVGSQVAQIAREMKVNLSTSDFETQEREVTILFSDICGFTSMSEKLTPSEIAFLLNGYFDHMADCVAKYHGYLNKYIGDAVMAVFGAPQSVGNDAANAINCGIEMLQRLRVYWSSIDTKKRFNIRIGVNTGTVTAGNIGSRTRMEYTVIGDSVNLASRLESNSEPNSILIGESTFQKVKDLFPLKMLGSIHVKGKQEPVKIYKVLAETLKADQQNASAGPEISNWGPEIG